jgi:beta-glucosidase
MRSAFLFAALLATARAQNIGEVVNAASYGPSVAPGSVAQVTGNPFFTIDPQATVSVHFDGGPPAPLFYVAGSSLGIQIPWELSGKSQITVTVTVDGQTSQPQAVDLIAFAPGIFTDTVGGTGQGVIVDASNQLLDSSNPAAPGSVVVIYCTGLGAVTNRPATGTRTPATPPSLTTSTPAVTIGGASAEVFFSGLAPGLIGEYQVNAIVAAGSATGNAVPVTISIGGFTSNVATIAVQPLAGTMTSDERAGALVAQMTQDEKIQLLHGAELLPDDQSESLPRGGAGYLPGIPSLGIPDLYLADGSVGVGNNVGQSTALPSSLASAAGWDVNEAYKYGSVIGTELRAYGMNVNLGGNVNLIGREPRDGRTFETKGEDPILAGKIAAAHIRGTQDRHVLGCIKHFALNDQETARFTADALIDERAARETDLLAFEIGVKDSNVQSVMCSYNLLNGTYACENPHLLNQVLKGDWGFKGYVMSDWWATHSVTAAALAGLDQEQPNDTYFTELSAAIQNGQVPQARLDDMVQRVLSAMFEAGLFDYPEALQPIDSATDQAVAQSAEEQGAVLLKNAGGQLPLNASAINSIAVIGSHADIAVLSGGGSAQVTPTGGPALILGNPCPPCWAPVIWDPSSPLLAIQALAPQATVRFADGTSSASAASLAASSDVAIVFVSQWASEGMDLPSLNFTDLIDATPIDQDALVAAVAGANPHTIAVLENGGPQVMPWLNNVSAVLESWYPGQRGGQAIANILFGAVNPSGKLPVTFPASVDDLPRPVIPSPGNSNAPFPVNYFEGLLVGYKWYESMNFTPLFPFGFGLSYTTFSLSNAKIVDPAPGTSGFQVAFDIENTGAMAGAEVAQVYVGMAAARGEPPNRLMGWQKVLLDPGALQHVTITVDENDSSHPLSYWDTALNTWRISPGNYPVFLGTDSASLTKVGTFQSGGR